MSSRKKSQQDEKTTDFQVNKKKGKYPIRKIGQGDNQTITNEKDANAPKYMKIYEDMFCLSINQNNENKINNELPFLDIQNGKD